MFYLFLNPILSQGFLPEIQGESVSGASMQLWVSPVSPSALPSCFVGCMCAWVCTIYICQSCCLLWSLSDQPCSRWWGEVRLWFSSTVTLSIESTGCNFPALLAEISVSLCCSALGPTKKRWSLQLFEVTGLSVWILCSLAGTVLAWDLLCWASSVCLCVMCAGRAGTHGTSTSSPQIFVQQWFSCPASETEQPSSQKRTASCKWVWEISRAFSLFQRHSKHNLAPRQQP